MGRITTLARLMVNAAPCAAILPVHLLALILLLNPEFDPGAAALLRGWGVLALAYGLPALAGLPAAFAVLRFFAARPLRIDWFQKKAALWFLVFGSGGMLGLYAWNLHAAGDMLGARGRQRLSLALIQLAAGWLAAASIAIVSQLRPDSGWARRRLAAALLLCATAPLSLLFSAFGDGRTAEPAFTVPEIALRGGPVVLVGVEGATFSEILPLVSEGRLPNFGHLLKEGAFGFPKTIHPCFSAPAWATLSTGRLPSRHGVKDLNIYRLKGWNEDLRVVPAGLFFRGWLSPWGLSARGATGEDLRAQPLWSILDSLRAEGAFLGWPLSSAPFPGGLEEESAAREARAKEWLDRLRGGSARRPSGYDGELQRAIAGDLAIHDTLMRIAAASRPHLIAAHFPGLGAISATFNRFRHPDSFEVTDEDFEQYGRVLPGYYELIDALLGEIRHAMPPDAYLMIVSAYGTETPGFLERTRRRLSGLPRISGSHDSGPPGILILAGPGVAAGRQVEDLRVTDVVPLTLYFLGLPVGRDMDGRLPRRLFERAFLEANPITFIPTYR